MMTTAIKEYKPILHILSYDGEITYSILSPDQMEKILNDNSKFIKIGTTIINKSDIRRVYQKMIDEIEGYIIQQPRHLQEKLRDKMKIKSGERKLENLQRYTQGLLKKL